jgi:hypothetical protein
LERSFRSATEIAVRVRGRRQRQEPHFLLVPTRSSRGRNNGKMGFFRKLGCVVFHQGFTLAQDYVNLSIASAAKGAIMSHPWTARAFTVGRMADGCTFQHTPIGPSLDKFADGTVSRISGRKNPAKGNDGRLVSFGRQDSVMWDSGPRADGHTDPKRAFCQCLSFSSRMGRPTGA